MASIAIYITFVITIFYLVISLRGWPSNLLTLAHGFRECAARAPSGIASEECDPQAIASDNNAFPASTPADWNAIS
jgi:hypothetical protein